LKQFFLLFLLFNVSAIAKGEPMKVEDFFSQANYENIERLCQKFYAPEVTFIDPIGKIEGLDELIRYYRHMYRNVIEIDFKAIDKFKRGEEEVFIWQMHLKHRAVSRGELIVVDGVSVLRFSKGKVIYHRDYFDLGAMLYENLPVLGSLVRFVKSRAHK